VVRDRQRVIKMSYENRHRVMVKLRKIVMEIDLELRLGLEKELWK